MKIERIEISACGKFLRRYAIVEDRLSLSDAPLPQMKEIPMLSRSGRSFLALREKLRRSLRRSPVGYTPQVEGLEFRQLLAAGAGNDKRILGTPVELLSHAS